MGNLLYSANITLPVMLLIGLGMLFKRLHLVDDAFIASGSRFAFRVAIPVSLFYGIYESGMGESLDLPLLFFSCGGIAAVALLLLVLVPRFVKDGPRAASLAQGIYRSNFVLVGVPLITGAFGSSAAPLVSSVMPFAIALFNVFAVIFFSTLIPRQQEPHPLGRALLQIVKNPLVIACLLSLVCVSLDLRFPVIIDRTLSSLSGLATPLSLIALGGQIHPSEMRKDALLVGIGALFRCVVVPTVVLALAISFGFRGASLFLLFILFGAPTAVSSYIMADQMGGDKALSAGIVAASTLLSTITLTAGIALLRSFQWI